MKEIEELRAKIKEIETLVSFTTLIVDLNDIVSRLEAKIRHLQGRDNWLRCLEQTGVDTWERYDIAQYLREEDEE